MPIIGFIAFLLLFVCWAVQWSVQHCLMNVASTPSLGKFTRTQEKHESNSPVQQLKKPRPLTKPQPRFNEKTYPFSRTPRLLFPPGFFYDFGECISLISRYVENHHYTVKGALLQRFTAAEFRVSFCSIL